MATIGTFKKTRDGFEGSIRTIALSIKAKIVLEADKIGEKAPDYRVFSGAVELGAAWKRTSKEGLEYLSVKLDDPSFPAPIYATLAETAGIPSGYALFWSRRNGD